MASESSSTATEAKRSSKIGPAAQSLLEQNGLSINDVSPSGPQGIITKGDVLEAINLASTSLEQQQQQQSSEPVKQQSKEKATDTLQQPASMEQDKDKKMQPSQEKPARQPADTSDVKIRVLLAKRLLEEGQQIPSQWLKDWARC